MEERQISKAVIKRLPRYYRYLGEMLNNGVERISSGELSTKMQVTASQIRQDLNNFGGFGQQGYGYNVKYLYHEIGKILGLDKTYNLIIIGAGNLGQAIANYANFERRGFVAKAMFDTNPQLKGKTVRGIPVYSMDDLENYVRNNDVQIAALTLPKAGAEAALWQAGRDRRQHRFHAGQRDDAGPGAQGTLHGQRGRAPVAGAARYHQHRPKAALMAVPCPGRDVGPDGFRCDGRSHSYPSP